MKHGTRNQEGKYYNAKTGKFVVKLRPSTKGVAKGNSSSSKLKQIKAQYPEYWESHGWLPIALPLDKLVADAQDYWKYAIEFEVDRAIALSTLLIITRNSANDKKKSTYYFKRGWTNVSTKKMKKWVHSTDYNKYIQHFEDMEYLLIDRRYASGSYPMQYKWRYSVVNKEGDLRKYHRVKYTKSPMILKAFEFKNKRLTKAKQQTDRLELIQHVQTVCKEFDFEGFSSWALANPQEFDAREGFDELNQYLIRVNRFREGDMYFNPKDDFGERFHSVFTNTKKELRSFIKIGGKPPVEIDIKNSQFFFLACLTIYPKESLQVLKGVQEAAEMIELLEFYYQAYPDFKAFINSAVDGTLYTHAITCFALNGKIVQKKWVKDLFFKSIFSQEDECKKSKEILKMVFPTLVRLGNLVNREKALLPKILQIFESRIVLDRIAMKALDQGVAPFVTVHDSYICAEDEAPLFKYLIERTFRELGLPVPKTS